MKNILIIYIQALGLFFNKIPLTSLAQTDKNLIFFHFAGYGNTTPTTELGKVVTIFYAIIGMPLFLLYLSNIGNLLLYDASDDRTQTIDNATDQTVVHRLRQKRKKRGKN